MKDEEIEEFKNGDELFENPVSWIIIILVLIATFLLIYSPHFSYPYPLHADEWFHLELAKRLVSGEYDFSRYISYPFAYNLISLMIFIFNQPVLIYKFLPALFAVLSSLFLFLLMYRLTKNFFIAIFSMIFFASLPSDVNLMGLWFATPFSLSLAFIPLSLLLFIKTLEIPTTKKLIILTTLILLITAFIHSSTTAFLFLIIIIYGLFNYKKIKLNPFLLVILFPAILYFFLRLSQVSNYTFTEILLHFQKVLTFTYPSSILQPSLTQNPINFSFLGINFIVSQYFLPVLYGIIPFLLALYGLYFAIKEGKLRIFVIWLLTSLFLLFIYNITEISLFARRQHVIYYSLLSLVPLSAIGLYMIIKKINQKIDLSFVNNKEIIKKLVVGAIIIFVLVTTFYNYGKQRQGTELYYLIDDYSDFQALTFLSTQEKGMVVAPLREAMAVYLIAGKDVFTKFHPQVEVDKERVENFFSSDCEEKKKLIETYKIKYVYSKFPISCDFLEEIYSEKERYIYKV